MTGKELKRAPVDDEPFQDIQEYDLVKVREFPAGFRSGAALSIVNSRLFVGGEQGQVCVMSIEGPNEVAILDPPDQYVPRVAFSLNQGNETLAVMQDDEATRSQLAQTVVDYLKGKPGFYVSGKYDEEIGRVVSLDAMVDDKGITTLVGLTYKGFIVRWSLEPNGTYEAAPPVDVSCNLAFSKKIAILPNGDIAHCSLAKRSLEIYGVPMDGAATLKFTYAVPHERWRHRVIHMFEVIQETPLVVVVVDDDQTMHMIKLQEINGLYNLQREETIPNPTRARYWQLVEEGASFSDVLTDPNIIHGGATTIACFEGTIAVGHGNGISLYSQPESIFAPWGHTPLSFGIEAIREDLGGCGSPKAVAFLSEFELVAAYEFGRVVIWRYDPAEHVWKPSNIRKEKEGARLDAMEVSNEKIIAVVRDLSGEIVEAQVEVYARSTQDSNVTPPATSATPL